MISKSATYATITRLFEQGSVDEALREIEAKGDALSPAEKLECEGNYFFYTRKHQEAIYKFEEAMTKYPGYHCARYHYLIGVQEEIAKNLESAFHRYNAAVEIEPSFVDAHIELGGLLKKVEDYEGAGRAYERALEFDPKDLRIYFNLMEVYRALATKSGDFARRFRQAQDDYERFAKELGPLPENHQW